MQKNQLLFILGLVLAIIITLFALTNANPVAINLLFYKFEASQALVIFFSATFGAIIVTLLGLTKHLKLKVEIKKLKKENEKLNKENEKLNMETEKLNIEIKNNPKVENPLPSESSEKTIDQAL